jgi:hypothetical protein
MLERAELERRAVERAMARGGAAAVREGRYPGVYHVASNTRSDRQHTVSVEGDTWRCDCEAGLAHRPCWAQAAVYLYQLEVAGLRVSGPAAAAPLQPRALRHPRREVQLT